MTILKAHALELSKLEKSKNFKGDLKNVSRVVSLSPILNNPLGYIMIDNQDSELVFKEYLKVKSQNAVFLTVPQNDDDIFVLSV